jgi:hypothetical protein
MLTGPAVGWTIESLDLFSPAPVQVIAKGTFDSNTPQAVALYDLTQGWNHLELPPQFHGTREYFQVFTNVGGVSELYIDNVQWSNVPEPSTWVLMLVAAAGLLLRRFF